MANVMKKDGNQGQQGQGQGERGLTRRDPYQQMMSRDPFQMLSRNPFQLMRELMNDPFRLFQMSPLEGAGGRQMQQWNPGFDIRETDQAFVFKADMPGIRSEDLDISLSGNQLQITGQREYEQNEEEGQVHTYERSFGSFSRSFALPESADLDNVHSDLKEGVLTLVVPKKPGASPQRRKIQIGSGGKS